MCLCQSAETAQSEATVLTCNVSSSVLVRFLFFNIGFNLLLHLGDKEVGLARQRGHVPDDVWTADLDDREGAQLPLLGKKPQRGGMMAQVIG